LVVVGVFVVWPLGAIVARGLRPEGEWDLGAIGEVFGSRSARRALWFSTWQAAASTLLTLLVALPAARVAARYRYRGDGLVAAVTTVPFVLPTVVVATAFWSLLGRSGPLARLLGLVGVDDFDGRGSVGAVLAAHVFFNHAVVVRTVGSLWRHLDPRLDDAAATLGADGWTRFRLVTLPLLGPAIAAAGIIVFLFCFTSFGVVLILGDRTHATVEVEIFRQIRQLDLDVAAVLALAQMLAAVGLLGLWTVMTSRLGGARRLAADADHRRRPVGRRQWAEVVANLAVMALLLGIPMATLVVRSLRSRGAWSLTHYRSLFEGEGDRIVDPAAAVWASLRVASIAAMIALVVGVAAATALIRLGRRWSRLYDTAVMVPLGASAVTVGFGLLITLDTPPLDLRSSPVLVPIAQAMVALPFVVRILVPVLKAIDVRLREAAAVLGAPPLRVWRHVDLPLTARAMATATGFGFAVSLGEFGASSVLVRSGEPTLPVAIFRVLGRPGSENLGQAMALSTVLLLVTVAVLILVERARVGPGGSF